MCPDPSTCDLSTHRNFSCLPCTNGRASNSPFSHPYERRHPRSPPARRCAAELGGHDADGQHSWQRPARGHAAQPALDLVNKPHPTHPNLRLESRAPLLTHQPGTPLSHSGACAVRSGSAAGMADSILHAPPPPPPLSGPWKRRAARVTRSPDSDGHLTHDWVGCGCRELGSDDGFRVLFPIGRTRRQSHSGTAATLCVGAHEIQSRRRPHISAPRYRTATALLSRRGHDRC